MRNPIKLCSIAFCGLFLTGCAASYKAIHPNSITYIKDNSSSPDITAEYHFNVLREAGNKKIHNKELKKNLQLVAVKITNNSNGDIAYNRDFQLYTGDAALNVVSVESVHAQLKQQAPLYLLYLLMSGMTFTSSTSSTSGGSVVKEDTNSFPIGLIVGPGIALYNTLVASGANKNFKEELAKYSISNSVIKKGETGFYLVGINSTSFQPVSARLMKR